MKWRRAPEYLFGQLNYICEIQPYNLRKAHNSRLPRSTTTGMQHSLSYKGLQLHNMLPADVKYNEIYDNTQINK